MRTSSNESRAWLFDCGCVFDCMELPNQRHTLIERKIEHLQSGILLELVDECLDATLIPPFVSVDARNCTRGGIVEKDHAERRQQSLECVIIETSLFFGMISVHEHHAHWSKRTMRLRLHELLSRHQIMLDVCNSETSKV